MNTTTPQCTRPLSVYLSLSIFLVAFGVSLAPRLARANWNDAFVHLKYGSELVMLLLPLWFIFRGKNWARWFLLVVAIMGFCLRMPQTIQQFHERSIEWMLTYCLCILAEVTALILLFLPLSNSWFRGKRHAIAV